MIMLAIIAHAAVATSVAADSTPVCQKLHADFVSNEKLMGIIHRFNQAEYDADFSYYKSMEPAERELKRARAQVAFMTGHEVDNRPSQAELKVEESRRSIEVDDEKFSKEGDRITTLLIANHCTPPDHITSWATYPNG